MSSSEQIRQAAQLHRAGRRREAEVIYRQVLQADPGNADAWQLLGMLAHEAGHHDDALSLIGKALELKPGEAVCWNNLSLVHHAAGNLDRAEECSREAVRLRPDYAAGHNNLAEIHKARGRVAQAVASYRAALAVPPVQAAIRGNYLRMLLYDPSLSPAALRAEHARWANLPPPAPRPTFPNAPDPDRPLRVGYVSPDFRDHAVSRFFEPIFAHHDRSRFQLFLYSEIEPGDAVTARYRAAADAWRPTAGVDADTVARQVRADGIDLLVDLAGHMAGNRLDVLAQRPAPVQLSYLGYPHPTGLSALDYWLSDPVVSPSRDNEGCEKTFHLPASFACFQPPTDAPTVALPPCLKSGVVTFGSLHGQIKLNDGVLALWRRVLDAVAGSRLLVVRSSLTPPLAAELLDRLEKAGIPRDRIETRCPGPTPAEYLPVYAEIDAVLDTVPFGGHTMTCEALWMGVPVVTLRGDRPCGRLTSSVLTALGHEELIAGSEDDYVRIARALVRDGTRLVALRRGLRERMRSRVCDGTRSARHLEDAYREVWRAWCQTAAPNRPVAVPPAPPAPVPPPNPPVSPPPGRTVETLHEQGVTHARANRRAEAVACFEEVLRQRPDYPPALNNLANLLRGVGCLVEAEQLLLRASQLQPDDEVVLNNLGEVYRHLTRFPEARAAYRAALRHAPPFHPAGSNLLWTLIFDDTVSAAEVLEEHRAWGRQHAWPGPFPALTNVPDPERRLRVGYVSPFFHRHSAPLFYDPILRAHDRDRFGVFLYGAVANPDDLTRRLQGLADGYRSILGRPAEEVAAEIRADGIDLLVDLGGHGGGHRLDVFARRPAPVQISYLIYPHTTGLEAVDVRLTDDVVDPPGEPPQAVERLVRLPGGFLPFQPPEGAPEVVPPPALARGYVTFGSPHLTSKLNDHVLDAWAQLLRQAPRTRLAFGRNLFSPSEKDRLHGRLRQRGVDLGRIDVQQLETGHGRHLRFAAEIDLFLDTFPFCGQTTVCEYLWMGVPVVTLRGDRPSGRVAASILTTLGLSEFIADTPEEYVALAARWARDLPGLARLRGTLRERVRSRLGDERGFTRRLEEAYRGLWRDWCQATARPASPPPPPAMPAPANLPPEQMNQRGLQLAKDGRYEEAAALFTEAVTRHPGYHLARVNLGMSLRNLGLTEKAIAVYQEYIRLAPTDPVGHSNLGSAYQALGLYTEAENCFRQAAALSPPFSFAQHNYLMALNYHPGCDGHRIFEEHRRWGERAALALNRSHPNNPDPARRLRVGYVSADFHSPHPVCRFFEPLLAHHDRSRFEVFLYGEVPEPDALTERLRRMADGYRSTVGLEAAAVAEQVRADRIDLLVDLSGHYAGNRLDVLAQQPAPVQITYLGYPNTTGLAGIDYWMTDDVVNPPDSPALATERIAYVPGGFSTFLPPAGAPEVSPLPALACGVFTFGSHHDLKKVPPPVYALWARVLHAVPGSRMLFLRSSHQPAVLDRLRQTFAQHGIDPARIVARQPPRGDVVYLTHYAEIDAVLDTFPFGGHTMTCEALWMGVPLVTLRGDRPCGRLSASVLTSCGLPEFIAGSPEEYLAIASRLTGDLEGLARLRAGLRERVRQALGDAPRFTRAVEDLYRRMWLAWCRRRDGLPDLSALAGSLHPAQTTADAVRPALPEALAVARSHREARRWYEAERLYRSLMGSAADSGAVWHGLGLVAWAAGRLDSAAEYLNQARALEPANPEFQADLARLQGQAATPPAVTPPVVPGDATSLLRQATQLETAGRHDEAVDTLRQAARIDPKRAEVFGKLGALLFDLARSAEAVEALRQAIALAPERSEYHNDLGNAYRRMERHAEAAVCYREALRLNPRLASAHANLGNMLAEDALIEEAREHFQRAHRLSKLPRLRLFAESLLPILYDSTDHVRATRERLTASLRQMEADGLRVDPTQEQFPTHFYLAYQGHNDRDLHAAFARLGQGHRRNAVRLQRRPRGKRVRIGFLSAYLRNHTIGQLNHNLIRDLDRERFEVFALSVGPPDQALSLKIQREADHFLVLPPGVPTALRAVADLGLDLLYYPDVGMDALSYTLAFSRLAPVQCVTWGHPVTTGLPTVDYFLSSQHLDPPGNEGHYTERLVRLSRLGVLYDRPELTAPPDRRVLGLPEKGTLYACPQTLFKFHPEFDPLLAEILRRDPSGYLVLIEGRCPRWNELLMTRLRRAIPDADARVRWLGRLSRPDYLRLLATSNVMLDPLHFGGGNTTYEGLALGVPVVTWPSPFLRGRLTLAMYQQMGFLDLVADDAAGYVERAVRLGTDPAYRQEMSRQIAEAAGVLYGDQAVVRELEKELLRMVEAGGRMEKD